MHGSACSTTKTRKGDTSVSTMTTDQLWDKSQTAEPFISVMHGHGHETKCSEFRLYLCYMVADPGERGGPCPPAL